MKPSPLLMLDFDGPVCAIFAPVGLPDALDEALVRAAPRARKLRGLINPRDPLSVLRAADDAGEATAAEAERIVENIEMAGAKRVRLTEGLAELIADARAHGFKLCIVTNNGERAVQMVARRFPDVLADVPIFAREPGRADLMKPHPHLLNRAVEASGANPRWAVLLGDSVTDVEAARGAGVLPVGYANKTHKRSVLTRAGAALVVDDLSDLDLEQVMLQLKAHAGPTDTE